MKEDKPSVSQELRSLVTSDGTIQLSLVAVPVPEPQADEVIVRVEATPINPSDLGLLFAGADMGTASVSGTADSPVVTTRLGPGAMRALAGRVGASMPVGNEGAGTVVDAGSSSRAQALLGRTVAVAGGAMYAQYRRVNAAMCLVLPEGTPAAAGASAFINPLTALGMVETMRREGHSAIVHTAGASNLGQMLNKLCVEEQVPLVNIVRRSQQVELLSKIGAVHVYDSTSSSFSADLVQALKDTGATLAFDAIGGGTLASQILTCMEAALNATAEKYSGYGSTTHKQLYIYGGLDPEPTVLSRNFGMSWSIGGWLLTPFLQSIGPEAVQGLRQRVASGLETTFASSYTKEISLAEALQPDVISSYSTHSTGEKYLINPHKP